MAGHAPELLPPSGRLQQWLIDLSDAQISFYMLVGAAAMGALLYLLDRHFFG